MLDPAPFSYATLALDLGSIASIGAMLLALPRRARGARDYGVVPWLVATSLPLILMAQFAEIRLSMASLHLSAVVPRLLAIEVGVPTLVIGGVIYAILRRRTRLVGCLVAVDVAPPQWPTLRETASRFLTMPAFVVSYLAGGLLLLTAATTLGFLSAGYAGPSELGYPRL